MIFHSICWMQMQMRQHKCNRWILVFESIFRQSQKCICAFDVRLSSNFTLQTQNLIEWSVAALIYAYFETNPVASDRLVVYSKCASIHQTSIKINTFTETTTHRVWAIRNDSLICIIFIKSVALQSFMHDIWKSVPTFHTKKHAKCEFHNIFAHFSFSCYKLLNIQTRHLTTIHSFAWKIRPNFVPLHRVRYYSQHNTAQHRTVQHSTAKHTQSSPY